MHPAFRDRVLRVSPDSRLMVRALAAYSAERLEGAVDVLRAITPENRPGLLSSEYEVAGAAAFFFQLVQRQLADWEIGPTPTEADVRRLLENIESADQSLMNWLRSVRGRNEEKVVFLKPRS